MLDLYFAATRGRLIRQKEKAARDAKTEFAVAEFEENFDELFERVQDGETLTIINTNGQKVYMAPLNINTAGKTT